MELSPPPGKYGDMSGYHEPKLTNKELGKLRTGFYAGNPATIVALVKEIDRLRAKVDDKAKL